ncbi:M48 family metallopeptidase [Ideonella alba]|uniref:M48 family metallopeptidase n=1 Tax=Ideonella alba TaxID=2824118 RepID=A0A940YEB9_9BURK|nr:SprT family zinc-dependent metalloprotease [Ideonella alba]MBQ0933010.1 M48 family metallopeptidase [Ideonella alba]
MPTPMADAWQLSLFDAPEPAPAPGASAPAAAGPVAVPASVGAAPASAPAPAPAPSADYRHPQADRSLRLGECLVAYQLRRARRKTIGFIVDGDGLVVSAPRWVSFGEIEAALREKATWILRKLAEQRDRRRRVEAARVEWRDGAGLPFLGETVILVLDPRVAGAQLNTGGQALPGVPRLTLHLGLPQQAEPAQIRDLVQSWLQRQARRVFEERCAHFAQRLGVTVRRLSLSAAQTRWGSASHDGSVRLNWRLIHFGLPVIDYVVAHELAHLREMNHSPAFWEVVRSVVPDYEQVRGSLRAEVLPPL